MSTPKNEAIVHKISRVYAIGYDAGYTTALRRCAWYVLVMAIACALALFSAYTRADTLVGVHLGTKHSMKGFCEANPGVYVKVDRIVAGAYKNSECSVSAYAGYQWESNYYQHLRAGLTVGGVTGYKARALTPLVIPEIAWDFRGSAEEGWGLRLFYLPAYGTGGAHGVHLSAERRFR